MPECFTWLHLTDLHAGMKNQDWLWPDIKEKFFEDLKKLIEKSGPADLVLFTGDLTQKGSAEEFEQVDSILNELWKVLQESGSEPVFLAVPGNHDLLRPADEEDPLLILLTQWNNQPKVREKFWDDPNSVYRQIVNRSFENYRNWWKRLTIKPDNINDGMLPGDFSATFRKENAKLGIVGLNTAFLQLNSSDYKEKLAIHARQFHKACGGSGPDWIKQHHACLFMTHHPVSWLNREAQQQVNEHIMAYGRFAVHLCGHMHETVYRNTEEAGTEARRLWQGRSLFGLEYFGDKKERREFGYNIGKTELTETQGKLFFFPRQIYLQGGQKEFIRDTSVKLIDELHTVPKNFDLHQSCITPSTPQITTQNGNSENLSGSKKIQIFIICADEDDAVAQRIYNDLEQMGCRPWLESKDVKAGQYSDQMFRSVMEKSDYILALLSKHSLTQRGMAQKQLKKALDIFEEFPSGEIFLIPIRLDDTEAQEETLRNLKPADFRSSYVYGFQQVVRAVSD